MKRSFKQKIPTIGKMVFSPPKRFFDREIFVICKTMKFAFVNALWLNFVQNKVILYHIQDFVAHYISFELDHKFL